MTNPQISHPHPPFRLNSAGDYRMSPPLGLREIATANPIPPHHFLQSLPTARDVCLCLRNWTPQTPHYSPFVASVPASASTFATRSPCPPCSASFSGCMPLPLLTLHQTQHCICLCFSSCHCPPPLLFSFRLWLPVPLPTPKKRGSQLGNASTVLLPIFSRFSQSQAFRFKKIQTKLPRAHSQHTIRHAQTVSVKS